MSEVKKLKYVGIYAPGSTWEEAFYHTTFIVVDGVAEVSDPAVIDALLRADFIPYEEWEAAELAREEAARQAAAEAEKKAVQEAAERLRESAGTAAKPSRKEKKAEQESNVIENLLAEDSLEPVVPADGEEAAAEESA